MTAENLAVLCALLETMKADQPWSKRHAQAFTIGLDDLDDLASQELHRQILHRFEWRPSVKEIRDLHQEIMTKQLPEKPKSKGCYKLARSEKEKNGLDVNLDWWQDQNNNKFFIREPVSQNAR